MTPEESLMLESVLAHARDHQQDHLAELFDFLRVPSISTLPEAEQDIRAGAAWLASAMERAGLQRVEIMPTAGLPLVYGEWLGAGPDAPTLLAYGHYDVQPVDPVDEWISPPFEPTIRGDDLFCRGASDDKGQVMAILAAVSSYLQATGGLPLNFKFVVEGEEEISSPNLAPWVREHREMLAADAVLICDSGILDPDTPLIMHGVRGMAYMEVEVSGPRADLHSGLFGGQVDNPFNVLVRMLAQLQDGETRRVLIPGFYDRVQPVDDEERALMAQIDRDEDTVRQLTGVPHPAGETGYTLVERESVRPSLDIHGMPGGFTGPGKKTVIPARARAKVSMRLVPDQDPEEIAALFTSYIQSLAPPTVVVDVRTLGLARPAVVDFRDPAIQAAATAYQQAFGAVPLYQRGGGTLPIVSDFQDILGAPVVMMGFGLPDDNVHAPNEKLHLPNFYRGIETVVSYLALFAVAAKS
jgi:acetylornithine deacetylase/succinyl-diaminopimelate desuccinylase-like protein